jgi:hypothetical protein
VTALPGSPFAQLQGLKQTLAQQTIAKAEAAKVAAAKKAAADKAARLFADTVGEVQVLKPRNAAVLLASKPAPIATQRHKD